MKKNAVHGLCMSFKVSRRAEQRAESALKGSSMWAVQQTLRDG